MMNLLAMTYPQLVDAFRQRYGRGEYHAAALYRAFYQSPDFNLDALPAFQASPDLSSRVRQDLDVSRPLVVGSAVEDDVTKLVLRLTDGLEIETVIIPMANHATVCISSQVGCRMGCRFCRTSTMGLRRNLTAAEMVAQVYTVRLWMGIAVRNVVLMGMGEPLDNFDAVANAIEIMEDQRGLDIAKRHITLSTVGLVDGLDALGRLNWPHLRLALSLNASNDDVRNAIMPVNRSYSMQTLKSALHRYPLRQGDTVFMEYVLIKGLNDQLQHARELVRYLEGLPVKINLIPYNPGQHASFEAPSRRDLDRFHQALVDAHLFVRVRSAKGAGIRAACGQLGCR